MAKKVDVRNPDSSQWTEHYYIESVREYDSFTISAMKADDWDEVRLQNQILYVDAETGVVVFDVEKYERSLGL